MDAFDVRNRQTKRTADRDAAVSSAIEELQNMRSKLSDIKSDNKNALKSSSAPQLLSEPRYREVAASSLASPVFALSAGKVRSFGDDHEKKIGDGSNYRGRDRDVDHMVKEAYNRGEREGSERVQNVMKVDMDRLRRERNDFRDQARTAVEDIKALKEQVLMLNRKLQDLEDAHAKTIAENKVLKQSTVTEAKIENEKLIAENNKFREQLRQFKKTLESHDELLEESRAMLPSELDSFKLEGGVLVGSDMKRGGGGWVSGGHHFSRPSVETTNTTNHGDGHYDNASMGRKSSLQYPAQDTSGNVINTGRMMKTASFLSKDIGIDLASPRKSHSLSITTWEEADLSNRMSKEAVRRNSALVLSKSALTVDTSTAGGYDTNGGLSTPPPVVVRDNNNNKGSSKLAHDRKVSRSVIQPIIIPDSSMPEPPNIFTSPSSPGNSSLSPKKSYRSMSSGSPHMSSYPFRFDGTSTSDDLGALPSPRHFFDVETPRSNVTLTFGQGRGSPGVPSPRMSPAHKGLFSPGLSPAIHRIRTRLGAEFPSPSPSPTSKADSATSTKAVGQTSPASQNKVFNMSMNDV